MIASHNALAILSRISSFPTNSWTAFLSTSKFVFESNLKMGRGADGDITQDRTMQTNTIWIWCIQIFNKAVADKKYRRGWPACNSAWTLSYIQLAVLLQEVQRFCWASYAYTSMTDFDNKSDKQRYEHLGNIGKKPAHKKPPIVDGKMEMMYWYFLTLHVAFVLRRQLQWSPPPRRR